MGARERTGEVEDGEQRVVVRVLRAAEVEALEYPALRAVHLQTATVSRMLS